jgi:hypothetical protein
VRGMSTSWEKRNAFGGKASKKELIIKTKV